MGNFIEAGKVSDFEDGAKKKLQAQGHEILLARIKDEFYAVSNRCPHLGGDLSEGRLEGTIITCPRHGSQFDIRDGKTIRWLKGSGIFSAVGKALKPPKPLETYNVKIEDNVVRIEI
jgi:3-phenylpropionate/trans-cinnamate dioxygenase ferredoxin subunit